MAPHDYRRKPLFKYKCRFFGAVFNVFTGTIWSGTLWLCHDCYGNEGDHSKNEDQTRKQKNSGLIWAYYLDIVMTGNLSSFQIGQMIWLYQTYWSPPLRCSVMKAKKERTIVILMTRLVIDPTNFVTLAQWKMIDRRFLVWLVVL